VLVAEPLEIRAQRFRAVFVCGLQEGSFPAPGSPEPFLSDDRRLELAARSGLRLRMREDVLARERYLFYSCVSRATERVVVSYRSSDEEGNIELPSPFVDDLAELFVPEWMQQRRRRLLADVVWPLDEAPTTRDQARARAVGAASEPLGDAALKLGEAALGKVRHSEILSAGALESYAECPVKWLVEKELQPRRFEPDPEPMVRGSLIHELLERLLQELGRPLTIESLDDANRILDGLLAEPAPQLARGRIEAVRIAALRSLEADLRRYLAHEAASGCDWDVGALELKFGFDDDAESLPALELAGGVRVRGMIDRVDVDGAGHAIVRDYKSGGKRPAYAGARWSQDQQLQVALYMLAVKELMGLDPVAGLYQPLGGEDLRSRGVFLQGAAVGARVVGNDARSSSELDEVIEDARDRAVMLAARLRSGDLEPCPDTCSRDGCKYPGICRSG
jgi:ATP-dependent helicase/DNAse subunit B